MRISLADSLQYGFKKWSDAQDAKLPPAAIGPLADGVERRLATVTAADEGRIDDVG